MIKNENEFQNLKFKTRSSLNLREEKRNESTFVFFIQKNWKQCKNYENK